MERAYEYRSMLYFLPWAEISAKADFQSEETQGQIVQGVNDLISDLPTVIEQVMEDNKGWEVNSHSIALAPDKTVLFSILLQRRCT
jgi:hypothetical protein